MGKITDYSKKQASIGTVLLYSGIIAIAVIVVYFLTASSDSKLEKNDQKQQKEIVRDSTELANQGILLKKQGDMVLKHDTALNDVNNYILEVDPRVVSLEGKVISLTAKDKHQQSLIYELQNDVSGLLASKNTGKKIDTNTNKSKTPIVTNDNGEEDEGDVEEDVEEDPGEE